MNNVRRYAFPFLAHLWGGWACYLMCCEEQMSHVDWAWLFFVRWVMAHFYALGTWLSDWPVLQCGLMRVLPRPVSFRVDWHWLSTWVSPLESMLVAVLGTVFFFPYCIIMFSCSFFSALIIPTKMKIVPAAAHWSKVRWPWGMGWSLRLALVCELRVFESCAWPIWFWWKLPFWETLK